MRSLRRQFDALLHLASARPAVGAGLRAAAATVLPLTFGEMFQHPAFLWMALGGWQGSLSDPGGAYRTRARSMLQFLLAALAVCALGAAITQWPPLRLPALFAVALLCCMLRALGDGPGQAGALTLVLFCLFLGLPVGGHGAQLVHAAVLRAELYGGGVLGAMLLALALWPFHPYWPVRRTIALCYRGLAGYLRDLLAVRAGDEAAWDALGRRERAAIREGLERARHALLAARGQRQAETPRGEQLLVLHETAELLLGAASAQTEALRAAHAAGQPVGVEERALRRAAWALETIAAAIEEQGPALDDKQLDESLRALQGEPPGELRAAADRLLGATLIALETARALREGRATAVPVSGLAAPAPPPSALTRLRAELSPRSLIARHALRVATAATAAQALADALHLQRSHWVTVTAVLVLQPSSGASLRRGLQRVSGTVLGGIIAALLGTFAHSPLVVAVILFPLTVAAVALLPVNYGLFATLVTPVFVLISESNTNDWHLTGVRILNTLLGGGVALLGALLLWPIWEKQRRPQLLAALLGALRRYLHAVLQREPAAEQAAARRQLGLAAGSAEASLQRALSEPAAREHELEAVMALLSWARRTSATATALTHAAPREGGSDSAQRTLEGQLEGVLRDLVAAVGEQRVPPPLPFPELPAHLHDSAPGSPEALLERLTRQVAALHHAVTRLAPGAPAAQQVPEAKDHRRSGGREV